MASTAAQWRALALLAFVLLAHIFDTLAYQGSRFIIDWGVLRWQTAVGADLFKLTMWLVLPLFLSLPTFEKEYFTLNRWKRVDRYLLCGVVIAGAIIMIALPWLPQVGDYYRGYGNLPLRVRLDRSFNALVWTLSWMLGWEFTHRYLLLKHLRDAWPSRGALVVLIIVPAIEGGYHFIQQKPILECLGMVALSLLFCAWALSRRNALLPFLGHFAIEVELIAAMFFMK